MVSLSLIVTSFDVGPWIDRALDSAASVLRPGDELIVVDDASRDDGPAKIVAFGMSGRLAPGVEFRPVLLGRNTPGGVGPAANIGLSLARGEILGFLDGDDWIEAEGFDCVRRSFEATFGSSNPADIVIANYLEWHETDMRHQPPTDAMLWSSAEALTGSAARKRALRMIGVPWRKLYRRSFIENGRLRFPEGNFFFEDNPFHWKVCLWASRILFHDRVICHHRVARSGQTMGSSGRELLAFFEHYNSILAMIAPYRFDLRRLALRWLVENMAWHMERMRAEAVGPWVLAANTALRRVPFWIWCDIDLSRQPVGGREVLELLRTNKPAMAESRLLTMGLVQRVVALSEEVTALRRSIERQPLDIAVGRDCQATELIQEFERLKSAVLFNAAGPERDAAAAQ